MLKYLGLVCITFVMYAGVQEASLEVDFMQKRLHGFFARGARLQKDDGSRIAEGDLAEYCKFMRIMVQACQSGDDEFEQLVVAHQAETWGGWLQNLRYLQGDDVRVALGLALIERVNSFGFLIGRVSAGQDDSQGAISRLRELLGLSDLELEEELELYVGLCKSKRKDN